MLVLQAVSAPLPNEPLRSVLQRFWQKHGWVFPVLSNIYLCW